jgi:hypothetical protein
MFLTEPGNEGKKPEPVVFLEVHPATLPRSPAALAIEAEKSAAAEKTVRVKVFVPYRVVYRGKACTGGQTLSVPPARAAPWLETKIVQEVSRKRKK